MKQKNHSTHPNTNRKTTQTKKQAASTTQKWDEKTLHSPSPQRNKKRKNNGTVRHYGINRANKAKSYMHHTYTHTPNIAPCIVCGANQASHTATRLEKSLNPKRSQFQTLQCGVGV